MARSSIVKALLIIFCFPLLLEAQVWRSTYRPFDFSAGPTKRIPQYFLSATFAGLPATDVADGDLGYAEDTDEEYIRRSGTWSKLANTDSGFIAPSTAPFVTYALDAGLSQERVLTDGSGTSINILTAQQVKVDVNAALQGWTDDGANVRLTTAADTVSIGTSTPLAGAELTVAGHIAPSSGTTNDLGVTATRFRRGYFDTGLNVGVNSTGSTGLFHSTSNAQADHYIGEHASSTAGNSVFHRFQRTRGTLASHTAVNAVDFIGTTSWEAEAGSGYVPVVQMIGYVISRSASNNVSGNLAVHTRPAGAGAALTGRFEIQGNGSVVLGDQSTALATTATDGFLYIRTCAGVPTGVPTAVAGSVPMIYDTTNLRLYVYSGGAWRIH